MKTTIQAFCQDFSTAIGPCSEQLDVCINALANSRLPDLNQTVLNLREIDQRLSTLRDKIAGQQAYLLIFGPLKSGKSTLMNAISGAYVSEVSSLPAYPALVYVKDGEHQRFEAVTYEGKKREFRNNLEMGEAITEDHESLASAILKVEREGESFDPRQHYPQAIRRIDIEIPAEELKESGSVLVDTPGLYSRMKFGYDQMTKDFRDTAACAIFVVKTDNLFFEKVFEEFEELLGYFSRIFLVSNIDTSKQDLQPDGSLEASLESREPEKVMEAFRSLSMSATLKEAIDEGRLNVYSIDLLKAASKRLGHEATSDEAGQFEEDQHDDGFDLFLGDLTSYLNSNDYLRDFIVDSLRVANDVQTEVDSVLKSPTIAELDTSTQQLEEKLDKDSQRLKNLMGLQTPDAEAYSRIHEEKSQLLEQLKAELKEKLEAPMLSEVDAWLESDESWNELTTTHLDALLAREASAYNAEIEARFKAVFANAHGVENLTDQQANDYRQAGIEAPSTADLIVDVHNSLDTSADLDTHIKLDPEQIPLKRGFMDVLKFRTTKQVRDQFFSAENAQPIPQVEKRRRLTGGGVEAIKAEVQQFVETVLPHQQQVFINQMVESYINAYHQAIQTRIETETDMLESSIAETKAQLDAQSQALQGINKMLETTERFAGEITDISARYGDTELLSDEVIDDEAETSLTETEALDDKEPEEQIS